MRSVYSALAAATLIVMTSVETLAEPVSAAVPQEAKELTLLPGFRAEKLYQVSKAQGSWVSMTFDDRGRIIASHEGGGLYRVTPSPLGRKQVSSKIEKLNVDLAGAQGLLYAFDSLYAVSNGVVRLRDTNGDGQFDVQERLLTIRGRGEHGPHAIVLDPAKKWLYVIAGNATPLLEGFERDRVAGLSGSKNHSPPGPQGWVMRMDPTGKRRELYAIGLRNSYGLAFNKVGDLFTFDSDNEGFMNLPWYRPTNIFHVVSGADFGWRQSSANLQPYHPDNVPPVLEVGPGSPTGMTFGQGAKFPGKYRRALFVCDWSYGRIYAVHLRADGATYRARHELFVSGRPLAVADARVGPDGALYFVTGGRGTQSAIYRVFYEGKVDKSQERPAVDISILNRDARKYLEGFHGLQDPRAVDAAWPYLQSKLPALRYSARTAIEHQPLGQWQKRAFAEKQATAAIEAMLAVVRQGDRHSQQPVLAKLLEMNWNLLTIEQQLAWLRVVELAIERWGLPGKATSQQLTQRIDDKFPNRHDDLNRELIKLLVKLKAKNLTDRTIQVLERTPTGMRQLHYLLQLNRLEGKFSPGQKERLVAVLDLEGLRDTATRSYKDVSSMMRSLFQDLNLELQPPTEAVPVKLVKKWKLDELQETISTESLAAADLANGKRAFRQAQCHHCHRIGNSGGVLGPNLTSLSARFRPQAVLEAIVDPDKVVSDQYRTTIFRTTKGKQFTGQIVNLSRGVIQIRLDPLRPFPRVSFKESEIEEIRPSQTSLMPKGLLNSLTKKEIRDLMGYLLAERR